MQNHERISELMDLYGTFVLHLAYSFIRDRQTAEDLTQEIFIKCYKNLNAYEGKAKLKTWVYRIAINHCKDYVKSWHYRKVQVSNYFSTMSFGSQNGPEIDYQRKEENDQLMNDVFKLPAIYKEIIILYYFHDFTLKEISEVCEIKLSTAKARMVRARELLKLSIIERVDEDGESIEKC
ncbi:sigma-70 family RNA polymerase sigma factor [Bacillus sp. JJ1562]|uniref:sigma-70 family RNA polymerase sigma factor n=1 Tax=Bacillus sp. JJ1562 TaxID=3122960 RepID=UPI003001193A